VAEMSVQIVIPPVPDLPRVTCSQSATECRVDENTQTLG
jgi:hypothetical protein